MNPRYTHHGATGRKGLAARAALAVLLGSGMALGTVALSAPAFAKDKEAKAEGNSKAFTEAYAPFQTIINNPSGDFASAKAMIPTIQATLQNGTDKDTFGRALIALGSKGTDAAIAMTVIQLLANGILQQLVQPVAYGAALGIHPLAVLIVTIAGGALFGAPGLILAAPLTSAAARIAGDISAGVRAQAEADVAAAAAD